ncbi:Acetylornithine deacetylase [Seminavis robusta]|uniref:Acetylornithine deacetylase n=1 Tax=Seminavis robusta TaxID=568900 RepID=A0A9N8EVD8_9STRA|nr:Acetylornithine deacetylase [Seminavis robusta]|eukprot:Sro1937_g306430.1 Acetylornithine deacetylase (454) ;mRNA; f:5223-6889
MTSLLSDELKDMSLDKDEYIALLTKLIGESKYLQNNPRQNLVPEEGRVAKHVLEVLEPFKTENGGPLVIQEFVYKEGRPNLKISFPGTSGKCTGLIGSHMDVVPANPETWERDPFTLEYDEASDKLFGRGTTDCLGHVAMITLLFKALAEKKPSLARSVVALFIAGEEGGESGVGVDAVVKEGHIEDLKNGTCYWIDSADSQPCTGTAGALQWHLTARGRLFHSGLPHRGINSLELASEALAIVQRRFYEDFPPCAQEDEYGFATPSTMKPTQIECAQGALNQLPPWTTLSGDIRLTPFYDPADVMTKVEGYVEELNQNMGTPGFIPTRGPCSKYTLEGDDIDIKSGKLELKWADTLEGAVRQMEGIACDLKSLGLQALIDATTEVKGEPAKPYAITGSLPLVRQMQREGFDVQITGFGESKAYHADNEYAILSNMKDAFQILLRVISISDKF